MVRVRDWQHSWFYGWKNWPSTGIIRSVWKVTTDDIPDPQMLRLLTTKRAGGAGRRFYGKYDDHLSLHSLLI